MKISLQIHLATLFGLTASSLAQTAPTPRTDAYESWKLAKEAASATDPATIERLPGFEVELLRTALPGEDSWVALDFDPKGRLVVAREKRGLLRFTFDESRITSAEVVEDELLECRGLLHAYGSLYVHANNSKGFYRLRDTDGDDRFDEKTLLLETGGGVGHGRNHLRLGPDGMIYLVHGDSVEPPPAFASDSPFRNADVDELVSDQIGAAEDKRFRNRHRSPYGFILRYDPRADIQVLEGSKETRAGGAIGSNVTLGAGGAIGSNVTLVAAGLRNPLDIDFNRDGEAFVYDADMEWDAGLPWYRPTRVLHIVSGGEYGWRRSPGSFPVYYEDSLPPVHDVGLGSPTGVGFGYGARDFPKKYRDACYIADWAYGRIIAIHLRPDGASYRGEPETFLAGRPLNVTDFTFGPGGAMYLVTGGRKTLSGLYRVTYSSDAKAGRAARPAEAKRRGTPAEPSIASSPNIGDDAPSLRQLRRELESLHRPGAPGAVEKAWPHLDHEDRWIRFAARVAIENQPPEHWQLKALRSKSLTAWLAVARVGHRFNENALLGRLNALDFKTLPEGEQLLALRVYQLAFIRMGMPDNIVKQACIEKLSPLYPSPHRFVNHELCELLVYLDAPGTLDKSLDLLATTEVTEDLVQYLYHIRHIANGWTTARRRRAFEALARAEAYRGGRTFNDATALIRSGFIAALSEKEKASLEDLLATNRPELPAPPAPPSPDTVVRNWSMQDLLPHLDEVDRERDRESGRKAYLTAGCAACHRLGALAAAGSPETAGGVLGPDLTGIANRFSRGDILLSVIHPSYVIGDKYRIPEAPNISTMPPGTINVLDLEQILDLLSFLESSNKE